MTIEDHARRLLLLRCLREEIIDDLEPPETETQRLVLIALQELLALVERDVVQLLSLRREDGPARQGLLIERAQLEAIRTQLAGLLGDAAKDSEDYRHVMRLVLGGVPSLIRGALPHLLHEVGFGVTFRGQKAGSDERGTP